MSKPSGILLALALGGCGGRTLTDGACDCSDAGVPPDAPVAAEAGLEDAAADAAPTDAGTAGAAPGDASLPDAGAPDAGVEIDAEGVAWDPYPRYCSEDGWCGANLTFASVWGAASDDVWLLAVGVVESDDGWPASVLFHWNGSRWSTDEWFASWPDDSWGPPRELRALWGAKSDDVWGVGSGGIVHYDGSVWSRWSTTELTVGDLRDVHGSGEHDVWTVGANGALLHWDGLAWREHLAPVDHDLNAVWVESPDAAWAVGAEGTILHFDGTEWASTYGGTTEFFDVWGGGWVVGAAATMLEWTGTSWGIVTSSRLPTHADLRAVWRSSANDAWAVGQDGTVLHWGGANWSLVPGAGQADLYSIWGGAADDVWVVGAASTARHWDGYGISRPPSATDGELFALWGSSPTDIWAAGRDLVHWDGSSWAPALKPAGADLLTLWGSDSNDVWGAGYGGAIVHYDGDEWTHEPSGTSATIPAMWGSVHDDVWAVDESGHVLHFDGEHWSVWPTGDHDSLSGIWGSSANNVLAVGGHTALHWDGNSWSGEEVSAWYHRAFGSPGGDIWVSGSVGGGRYGANILQRWHSESSEGNLSGTFGHVGGWAGNDDDVWAVLQISEPLIHWDGTEWTPSSTGSNSDLNAIWGNDRDLWALGSHGTILRQRRE
ncbi:MAG: hypothetical protein JW751_25340 [Polyangiaceae bacterium]|nr:hypothetical protein [Polyangiaceae bacterium]